METSVAMVEVRCCEVNACILRDGACDVSVLNCPAERGGGGYSQKNWVGVCGPLPKTLTLFMTKICDFPYPIYDLTKNLIPYL